MESIGIESENSFSIYDKEVNKLKLKIKLDIKLREFISYLYSTKITNLHILVKWLELLERKYNDNNFIQMFKSIVYLQNGQDYIDHFIYNLKIFELDNEELIIDILNVVDITPLKI